MGGSGPSANYSLAAAKTPPGETTHSQARRPAAAAGPFMALFPVSPDIHAGNREARAADSPSPVHRAFAPGFSLILG